MSSFDLQAALLDAIGSAHHQLLGGQTPPSEILNGLLATFLSVTGSKRGCIAKAVIRANGDLALVVRSGVELTGLAGLLGPALGSGQPHASSSFLGLPLMGDERLIGIVGLTDPDAPYPEELVEQLQPLVLATAMVLLHGRTAAEARRAESALQRSEERRRLASLQRGVVTWEHDIATHEIRVDPFFHEWLGVPAPATAPRAPDWEVWHTPIDRAVAEQQIAECRSGARPTYEYEARARRSDGEELRLLVRGSFLRTPDGEPFLMVCSAADITEDRRIEQARREHEARIRAVMEGSLDAVLVCIGNGEIQMASRSAQKLFGFTELELVGRNLATLLGDPESGRSAGGQLWDAAGVVPLRRRQQTQALRKDGSTFAIETSVAEARIGPRPLFAVIVRDLAGRVDTRTPVRGVPILKATRELVPVAVDRKLIGSLAIEADGTLSFVSEGCRAVQDLESVVQQALGRRDAGPIQTRVHDRVTRVELEVKSDPIERGRRHVVIYDASPEPQLQPIPSRAGMIGDSPSMRRLYAVIEQVAMGDWNVLIEGETGVGKDLVARAIHGASSRASGRFVAVNCAGMTDTLLGSQLFGHVRGAFTGATADHQGLIEAASGGTLFLDEIGDISADLQRALLRVLEDKEIRRVGETRPHKVDVRILSATHRDLAQRVAAGQFREDLLYRIRVARVRVAPLRERREDLPMLVQSFLGRQSISGGKLVLDVSPAAMALLMAHGWPGNVRELRSAIGHAAIHCHGSRIEADDLPPEVARGEEAPAGVDDAPVDERERILDALRQTGGNRSRAARLLGIGRATLYRRLDELGIAAPDGETIPPGRH